MNGSTIRDSGEEKMGDYLHWYYINEQPVVGYELTSDDTISFMYLTY